MIYLTGHIDRDVSCLFSNVMSLGVALDLRIVSTVMTGWVGRVEVSSVCFSVCVMCSTMYRVLCWNVLCVHVGVVAL